MVNWYGLDKILEIYQNAGKCKPVEKSSEPEKDLRMSIIRCANCCMCGGCGWKMFLS